MEFLDRNPNVEFVPLSFPIKNRIFVCGSGGKSSLAKSISSKYGQVHIELDSCKFLPNWEEREVEDFKEFTSIQIKDANSRWVIEGNYVQKLGNLILKDSELIIWLDLSWQLTFWRIFLRSIDRCIHKKIICGGNSESWRQFLSKDALWWYYFIKRSKIAEGNKEFLPLVPPHIPVVRIRTRKELNCLYKTHGLQRIR